MKTKDIIILLNNYQLGILFEGQEPGFDMLRDK